MTIYILKRLAEDSGFVDLYISTDFMNMVKEVEAYLGKNNTHTVSFKYNYDYNCFDIFVDKFINSDYHVDVWEGVGDSSW